MPELEYILMNKTNQPYRVCRQLVLDSRKTLGMGKYDPWTQNLHDAAMRLYLARFGAHIHKSDADSTTISSYSLDGSEDISHNHESTETTNPFEQIEEEEEDLDTQRIKMEDSASKKRSKLLLTKRILSRMRRAIRSGGKAHKNQPSSN